MENEPQWRTALGGNADHYFKHFEKVSVSGRRWLPGWNSAAFVHSTAWLCYRRMYGWAFLNLAAPWILLFILIALPPGRDADTIAQALLAAYLAAVFIVLPLFADSFYYRHLAARLAHAKPPSIWSGLAAGALAVAYFASVLAMVLPAYGDYTPRAKLSEGLLAASNARTGVTEFYAEHRRFPDAAEGARLVGEAGSARVQSIIWDPGARALVITMRDPFPGKRLALRAVEQDGQLVSWKCGPIDIDRKHMPGSCRD
jgi:type IV pilus assembly protein PilA